MSTIHNESTVIYDHNEFSDCTLLLWNLSDTKLHPVCLRNGTWVNVRGVRYGDGTREFMSDDSNFIFVKWTPSGHAIQYRRISNHPTLQPEYDIVSIKVPEPNDPW
jgi:hypothetical protein